VKGVVRLQFGGHVDGDLLGRGYAEMDEGVAFVANSQDGFVYDKDCYEWLKENRDHLLKRGDKAVGSKTME
ncbi:hypothetical protein HDU76_010511, partial [Blyttiomyces sp. JEL0837]